MARKRKVVSSEPQHQGEQQPEPQPEPSQPEAELSNEIDQGEEKPANEPPQEQIEEQEEQDNEEEVEQEQLSEEKEQGVSNVEVVEKGLENEEQDEKDEEKTESLDQSNDVVSKEKAPPEANGGGEEAEEGRDEEEDDLEEEPVEKLLESFSKEQLVVLLKEAVSKYSDLIESVQKLADADPARRKIFVHGFGWDIKAENLISVFGKYGEIEDCKAVCDKVSGKSKGYGFILFKHRSGAKKALKQPQKKIGNRMTSCQLASTGPITAPPPTAPVSEYTQRKIFVSNVSAEIEPHKLLDFFSKYGEVEEGPLGLDRHTGKPKGFALFVYKSIESAKKALEEPYKIFEGHNLHCQKAIDGPKQSKGYYQQHPQQQQQQQHQHQHQNPHQHQPYQHYPSKKAKYASSSAAGSGHLMAPSGPPVGYNPAVPAPALSPALGQALTALLATQGAGMGISNMLGGLGAPVNQGAPPMMNNAGYGNQSGSGYVNQPPMLGYQNPQMGQASGRPQQGGVPPYMGHGH